MRVQGRRRLVENGDARALHQYLGQTKALPHPAREGRHPVAPDIGQSDPRQCLGKPLVDLAPREPGKPPRVGEVIPSRQRIVKADRIGQIADPTLDLERRVGYLPDSVGFYDTLSARDNLAYTGRLAGLSRREIDQRFTEALARVGLPDVGRDRVATFSRGMRQRLGLAEVLMKRPSIAILDEPTATLDPHSTQEFLGMIRGLKADGTAVLLSSHHLDQVQSVCDRAALFNRGRIALSGSVNDLAHRVLGS